MPAGTLMFVFIPMRTIRGELWQDCVCNGKQTHVLPKSAIFRISREHFADSVFDLCYFLILLKTGNPATQFSSHVFMFMQMCLFNSFFCPTVSLLEDIYLVISLVCSMCYSTVNWVGCSLDTHAVLLWYVLNVWRITFLKTYFALKFRHDIVRFKLVYEAATSWEWQMLTAVV